MNLVNNSLIFKSHKNWIRFTLLFFQREGPKASLSEIEAQGPSLLISTLNFVSHSIFYGPQRQL